MKTFVTAVCGCALVAALSGSAAAGVISAQFDSSLGRQVSTSLGNFQTVKFEWTRTDAPAPGVDATIAPVFNTYCVQISEHVAPATPYTFNVVTPAAHGFSATQEILLGRLWNQYFASIDTAVESSAFQVAVWEIALDSGLNFASGGLTFDAPADTVALAETYLAGITQANYAGGFDQIVVLESDNAQDQITVVPAPGAAALAGLGGLLVARRRR